MIDIEIERAIKILGTEEKEVQFIKEYAQKFFHFGVRIVKNTGKNIVIVTPLMMTAVCPYYIYQ